MKLSFLYTGLRVRDVDRALRFYEKGLGMKVTSRGPIKETGGEVVDLEMPGGKQKLELNWYPPGSRFDSPYVAGEALDHLGFKVEEGTLEEAIRALEEAGGKLVIPPFQEGGGTLAYVDSPDGHTVELWKSES